MTPRDSLMAKVRPYHTVEPELAPERNVYHDQDNCPYGLRIEPEHLRLGEAGRPKCLECEHLDRR